MQTLLRDSVRFFSTHLTDIALIILPFSISVELLDLGIRQFFNEENSSHTVLMAPTVVGLLVTPVYAAALVFFMASTIAGKRLEIRACWRLGVRYWYPFLVLYLLIGLAVTVGFVLLIVPGLIAVGRLAFAEFELLLEGRSPDQALRTSWTLTKPYMWTVLGGYLVLVVVLYTPYYLLVTVLSIDSTWIWSITSVVYSVLGALFPIFAFRVYYEAKGRSGGGLEPAPGGGTG